MRGKTMLITGGAAMLFIAGIFALNSIRREPMTPKDVIEKTDWNKRELALTLARAHSFSGGAAERREMFDKLRTEMEKLPAHERDSVNTEAFGIFIDDALSKYRALPPDKRRDVIAAVSRAVSEIEKKTPTAEEKKKMEEFAKSPEAKKIAGGAMTVIQTKLTPQERADFSPVTKLWISMMEREFQ